MPAEYLPSLKGWVTFTSVSWLDSPSPSATSITCHVELHTAASHFWCFPTMQQDLLVHGAYCLLFSCNSSYGRVSSAHVTSISSNDVPKSLPSGHFVMTSKIPVWLRLPIQSFCIINVTHLLCVASVAWQVQETLPLNIHPSIGSWGARRSYLSTNHLRGSSSYLICYQYFFFSCSQPQLPCSSDSKTPEVSLTLPLILSAKDSMRDGSSRLKCRALL